MNNFPCPLCNSNNTELFSKDKKREYFICNICNLIFVPSIYHLSPEEEAKRYTLHQNCEEDVKYIEFLSRVKIPLIDSINKESKILDFGCGPGPVLKKVFKENTMNVYEYDPIFNKNTNLLKEKWDIIITTEVVEHVSNIEDFFIDVWKMLKSGGSLLIMTQLYSSNIEFKSWYYKGDPTHILFFSRDTFRYISSILKGKIEFFDKDIIILKKS